MIVFVIFNYSLCELRISGLSASQVFFKLKKLVALRTLALKQINF